MRPRRWPAPILFGGVVVLLWELLARTGRIKDSVLPAPSTITARTYELREYLLPHVLTTLEETLMGFAIGSMLGLLLGIAVAYLPLFRKGVYPYLVTAQVIPKVALAPLFLIWLGYGLKPKVAIAALICFFPVVINTAKGFASVPVEWHELMSALGARRYEYFFKVSLPHTLPYLFAALKVSISLAVIGAVVGELVGADSGLGYLLNSAIASFDLSLEFSALFILAFMGLGIFGMIALIERALIGWERQLTTATAGPAAATKEDV
jgi:NitT/TauT family transport system permease protein